MIAEEILVYPCDLFFTRDNSWLSWAIRRCETGWGESPAEASHVGGFVGYGNIKVASVVEAQQTVIQDNFWKLHANSPTQQEVLVARPMNLLSWQRNVIVDEACSMIGEKYGYMKIGAHFLDGLFGGVDLFRKMFNRADRPICSWVWAEAFSKLNLDFGCPYYDAQPDDMLDFIRANPDKYKIVQEWTQFKDDQ